MSGNLSELVQRYTIKHDRKIKKICAPLKDCLNISTFAYYSIGRDGRFCIMSNFPEQLDFFYSEKLFLQCPYLTHPSLFHSDNVLVPITPDPYFMRLSKQLHQVSHLFLILNQCWTHVEGYFFISNTNGKNATKPFINNLDLLHKFGRHFKREAHELITDATEQGYNLHEAKGKAFLTRDPSLPLSKNSPERLRFLKEISQLSTQENLCVDLYRQGHSAQSTAGILGLSPRTVEHYFENIKNKLGYNSKRDLLVD